MLKRIYVNNFRCLVNFELTVDSLNLLPPTMRLESLTFDGQPLFDFWVDTVRGEPVGKARIYNDDPIREGAFLPYFDGSRSGIGFIYERPENQKLTWFKKRIANFFIVQINPFAMEPESRQEASSPNWDMSNYAAWYSYFFTGNQTLVGSGDGVLC